MRDYSIIGMAHESRNGTKEEDQIRRTLSTPPPNQNLVTRDFGMRAMLDSAIGNLSENSEESEIEENLKRRREHRTFGLGAMLEDAVYGSE